MKNLLTILLLYLSNMIIGQTYLHGTTGIQGERVTHCLESTCSGTYLDNGGISGNYALNILGGLYRVFCPSTVGSCMRVTFNSFSTEAGFDFLTIGNGATQNSPVFTNPPALNPSGRISGNPIVPFSYTANNPSGCLTFRFTSDFSITSSGWAASLSCVPCATIGNGPNLTDNNDCNRLTELCSGTSFNSNSRGPGLVAEGCNGSTCPAGGENHSNWYSFTIRTSGTLTMLIDPQTNTDDYDFAIYGPNRTCGSLGPPLRCTDSGNTGNTGMTASDTGNVENVFGDGFLQQMNVLAGETYILVVDEWMSNTGNGYNLSFGGTSTLDCSPLLNIDLVYFGAEYRKDTKDSYLSWGTISEYSNEYYIIEKSVNGIDFDSIGKVESKGIDRQDYSFIDETPIPNGYTYYRLRWSEGDSKVQYSDISAIAVNDPTLNGILVYPNPFENILKIENYNDYYGPCGVKIINSLGHLIFEKTYQLGISNKIEINTIDLPKGVYTITVTTSSTKIFKIQK